METIKLILRSIAPTWVRDRVYKIRVRLRRWGRAWLFPVISCQVRQVTVQLAAASELELFRAASYTTKEPEMLDWLDQNLRDSDVLFDVGANIGLYSLYAAKKNPTARIYAFEPESQNFSRLCRNIVLNKLKNITPCCFPLADADRFDSLYVGEMIEGGSEHSFGELNKLRPDSAGIALKQGALALTLNSLVDLYGLPAPTLLKIDVDGLEEKILRGAEHVLRSAALRSLIIEFNTPAGTRTPPQAEWLKQYGLELAGQSQWIYKSNGMQSQNFIFVRAPADALVTRS